MADFIKATVRNYRGLVSRGVFIAVQSGASIRTRGTSLKASITCPSPSNEMADVEKHLAEVPSCQPWLDNNPAAKASLELGLQQASQGRGRYLGSFAQFADLEIED